MLEKHLFIMMELKYLPEPDSRIVLWRNTIQLFHEYKRPKFIGPFKAAKFSYRVESLLTDSTNGKPLKPDIVASGKSGWFVLELTESPNSKKPKLESYDAIDPRDLSQYGLIAHSKKPDIIISRLSKVDDGSYCQILVRDHLKVENEGYIKDKLLRDSLINAKETDLNRLPNISISLLPEMKTMEIRRGLIEIVIQLFQPEGEGKTVVQIVDEGLDKLSGKIGPAARTQLIEKVNDQMKILIKNYLSEYLEFKENKYISTGKFKQHHKTMQYVVLKLGEWAGISGQRTFDDFP